MIFTILKVIGIILLVVLALILTALLCVLFVPVKYRAVGSFDNTDIRAKAVSYTHLTLPTNSRV